MRTLQDWELKQQAVQPLNTSGRPLAHVARELELPPWQLRNWKNQRRP
jgi:transposase-like protein